MIAVVERDVDRLLAPCEKKSALFRIFADGVDDAAGRNAIRDFHPALAAVARAENVRSQIVETERIDRRIGTLRIEMRGLHDRDFRPGHQLRRGDISPRFSAVGRDVDQSVVRAGPDAIDIERRRREGVDDAALRDADLRCVNANVRRHAPCLARQIGTDLRPALTAIGRPPQRVRREVKRVRIDR